MVTVSDIGSLFKLEKIVYRNSIYNVIFVNIYNKNCFTTRHQKVSMFSRHISFFLHSFRLIIKYLVLNKIQIKFNIMKRKSLPP